MLGVCVNFLVRYRYPQCTGTTAPCPYINYLDVRDVVLRYAEPSAALPALTFWEVVNAALVRELASTFNVTGVASQLQVKQDRSGRVAAGMRGAYGSTAQAGEVSPPNEPMTGAFDYSQPCPRVAPATLDPKGAAGH